MSASPEMRGIRIRSPCPKCLQLAHQTKSKLDGYTAQVQYSNELKKTQYGVPGSDGDKNELQVQKIKKVMQLV